MAASGAAQQLAAPPLPAGSRLLVEFRAGRILMEGTTAKPDSRKGLLRVLRAEDGLLHLEWWSREGDSSAAAGAGCKFDEIVFPEEAAFQQPAKAPPRVYMLKFKEQPDRDVLFWMQEPSEAGDADICRRVNAAINTPLGVDDSDMGEEQDSGPPEQMVAADALLRGHISDAPGAGDEYVAGDSAGFLPQGPGQQPMGPAQLAALLSSMAGRGAGGALAAAAAAAARRTPPRAWPRRCWPPWRGSTGSSSCARWRPRRGPGCLRSSGPTCWRRCWLTPRCCRAWRPTCPTSSARPRRCRRLRTARSSTSSWPRLAARCRRGSWTSPSLACRPRAFVWPTSCKPSSGWSSASSSSSSSLTMCSSRHGPSVLWRARFPPTDQAVLAQASKHGLCITRRLPLLAAQLHDDAEPGRLHARVVRVLLPDALLKVGHSAPRIRLDLVTVDQLAQQPRGSDAHARLGLLVQQAQQAGHQAVVQHLGVQVGRAVRHARVVQLQGAEAGRAAAARSLPARAGRRGARRQAVEQLAEEQQRVPGDRQHRAGRAVHEHRHAPALNSDAVYGGVDGAVVGLHERAQRAQRRLHHAVVGGAQQAQQARQHGAAGGGDHHLDSRAGRQRGYRGRRLVLPKRRHLALLAAAGRRGPRGRRQHAAAAAATPRLLLWPLTCGHVLAGVPAAAWSLHAVVPPVVCIQVGERGPRVSAGCCRGCRWRGRHEGLGGAARAPGAGQQVAESLNRAASRDGLLNCCIGLRRRRAPGATTAAAAAAGLPAASQLKERVRGGEVRLAARGVAGPVAKAERQLQQADQRRHDADGDEAVAVAAALARAGRDSVGRGRHGCTIAGLRGGSLLQGLFEGVGVLCLDVGAQAAERAWRRCWRVRRWCGVAGVIPAARRPQGVVAGCQHGRRRGHEGAAGVGKAEQLNQRLEEAAGRVQVVCVRVGCDAAQQQRVGLLPDGLGRQPVQPARRVPALQEPGGELVGAVGAHHAPETSHLHQPARLAALAGVRKEPLQQHGPLRRRDIAQRQRHALGWGRGGAAATGCCSLRGRWRPWLGAGPEAEVLQVTRPGWLWARAQGARCSRRGRRRQRRAGLGRQQVPRLHTGGGG